MTENFAVLPHRKGGLMARRANGGIFCLEGEWDSDLRSRDSVEPILDLLERLRIADSIHRDVATTEELKYFLGKWVQKRYDNYRVLYLAMHGTAGSLYLGSDEIDLDTLEELLRDRCVGRAIYFGSCLTMRVTPERLMEFAANTGARVVVGYRKSVDWLDAAAFEVLLLDRLTSGLRSDAVFNHLSKEHGSFAESLGLVVATKSQVHGAVASRKSTTTPVP